MYLQLLRLGQRRVFIYNYNVIMNIFVKLISILILQKFWKALYADDLHNYIFMVNYAIVAQMLAVIYYINAPNKLAYNIRTGGISTELLRPWNYIITLLFEDLGAMSGNLAVVVLPLILISRLCFNFTMPKLESLLIFIVCVILAYIILFLIKIIISMLCFWVIEASSFLILINVVINLLSGQFLPSWLLPSGLKNVMNAMPFVWTYQKPIEIYLSKLNGTLFTISDYLSVLHMQMKWITCLTVILVLMWKIAIKKINIQGG